MKNSTIHYLLVGDCTKTNEIFDLPDIDLLITSPPYFNAPFDYTDLFANYEAFLVMIYDFARIFYKALKMGAIAAINIDDMLVKGVKYPIISDVEKIFCSLGYNFKGRIIWKKPDGYVRISQRSGVFLQHPYPMYYYPDNLVESILLFQKPQNRQFEKPEKIFLDDIWELTNVLPFKGRLEEKIAAFPDELPKKLITLFTKENSYVCDPFLGSGTTMKVARELNRNSLGVEILEGLIPIIRKKTGFTIENLASFFPDPDKLIVKRVIKSITIKNDINASPKSLIKTTLQEKKQTVNDFEYHLILLDLRNKSKNVLRADFSEKIKKLHLGRVAIVLFDPMFDLNLFKITDLMFQNNLRFRDKITVRYTPNNKWKINTNTNKEIVFDHCYYEVLIFQKGKFNYTLKSKEEKQASRIDKETFQKEKWFLSFWDFRKYNQKDCDQIVISRLIELFLFKGEKIDTNLRNIVIPNKRLLKS